MNDSWQATSLAASPDFVILHIRGEEKTSPSPPPWELDDKIQELAARLTVNLLLTYEPQK